MPTPTYIPLATTTLASATFSVLFSGFSQGYRDLVLVVSGKCDVYSSTLRIVYNQNGSYYYTVTMDDGGWSYNDEGSSIKTGTANWWTTRPTTMVCTINDYAQTDRSKQTLIRYGSAYGKMGFTTAHFTSTAAISTIRVETDYNSAGYLMAAGTTLSLYGIAG